MRRTQTCCGRGRVPAGVWTCRRGASRKKPTGRSHVCGFTGPGCQDRRLKPDILAALWLPLTAKSAPSRPIWLEDTPPRSDNAGTAASFPVPSPQKRSSYNCSRTSRVPKGSVWPAGAGCGQARRHRKELGLYVITIGGNCAGVPLMLRASLEVSGLIWGAGGAPSLAHVCSHLQPTRQAHVSPGPRPPGKAISQADMVIMSFEPIRCQMRVIAN